MPAAPMSPEPTAPQTPSVPQAEIDSGKTMAILSYIPLFFIGLIVAIISLSQKNNAFSLYHAKQALALYIVEFVAILICIPLCFVCIGFILVWAVGLGSLVLCILGIINASGGQCKPLPVVGKFADKWFGKVQKA